jgi:hypothetical protein
LIPSNEGVINDQLIAMNEGVCNNAASGGQSSGDEEAFEND